MTETLDPSDDRRAQVQVIPLFKGTTESDSRVLLFKRNEAKGGFWQPITGGVNHGEDVESAAIREVKEESGITIGELVNDRFTFEFEDDHHGVRKRFTEHVLALTLPELMRPTLSDEHTESRWSDLAEALALLKYDSNKAALNHYWNSVIKRE